MPDVLAYLAGSWRVERTVRDFAGTATDGAGEAEGTEGAGGTEGAEGTEGAQEAVESVESVEGRFEGITRFTPLADAGPGAEPSEAGPPEPAGLLHHESGTFTWHGVARPAERTLRFLPGTPAGTAVVQFADGRPFHDLDLRSGRHTADHPCAADLYRGEFEVYDASRWRTRWRVAGPAKDLLLTTDYTRLP
ncbi:DUF6314 family protein [Streptomyces flavofungini]|nr:DUF6314 family protein [Streptomyces flavofungini]WJV51542.1 DUF6314 family protein [Streptomyces flavofungini]